MTPFAQYCFYPTYQTKAISKNSGAVKLSSLGRFLLDEILGVKMQKRRPFTQTSPVDHAQQIRPNLRTKSVTKSDAIPGSYNLIQCFRIWAPRTSTDDCSTRVISTPARDSQP